MVSLILHSILFLKEPEIVMMGFSFCLFIPPFLNHIYLKFYLFPAKVVVELAKVHEIQAAVLLHPSLLTVDDIKGQLFQKSFFPETIDLF